MTRPLEHIDPAVRRRMIDFNPDAFDLALRLAEHPNLPTRITSVDPGVVRTTFEIELNGRPHRLTIERIRGSKHQNIGSERPAIHQEP